MGEKISEIRKQVEAALAFSKNPLEFLQKDAEQNVCFSRFKVGPIKYLHIFEPDLIKHIFQTNFQNYTKDPQNFDFRSIMGNGLLMNDSATWQQQRKLIQPLMQPKHSAYYAEQIKKCADEMIDKWRDLKEIDIYSEMNKLSFSIISHALFGSDLKKKSEKISAAIYELTERLFYSTQTVLKNSSAADNEKLIKNKQALDNLLFELIAERKKTTQSATDLLNMLLEAKYDDGSNMGDEQIKDELITLLFAGADTTASALTFMFYSLAKEEKIKHLLRNELKNTEQKTSLSIHIIHEVLRLYPPGWLISRIAANDDAIGDLSIKKDETILVSPFVMHRSKDYWPEPEQFRPSRFESFDKITKYSYIPFSSGPKTCVGNNFAMTIMQIVLASVINNFDITVANEVLMDLEPGLTLRPKNKILMKIHSA